MTFYHFLNCALLAYGPLYVSYYGLGIAEERQWPVCLRTMFLYLFSQIVKMILIATFIPISSSDSFHASTEIKRLFISLIDVAVIGFILYNTKGNRKIRDLAVAIGWSCAESIFGCFLPLFSYARGNEFDWSNIQICLGANIHIVSSIGFVSVVSILTSAYSKKNSKPASPAAYIFLLLHLLCHDSKSGIPLFAKNVMGISMWAVLSLQVCVAILVLSGSRYLSNESRAKQD
jgi:hypothetical protein